MNPRGPGRWVKKLAFVMPPLPDTLDIDPYLAALLHCAAFLELSEDDAVDPDAAVEVMESITIYLQRVPEEQVADLRNALQRISEHGRRAGYPPALVDFIDGFVENFGVADPR